MIDRYPLFIQALGTNIGEVNANTIKPENIGKRVIKPSKKLRRPRPQIKHIFSFAPKICDLTLGNMTE